jgi:hypothetical protein
MDNTGNFVFSISGSSGDDQLSVPIAYNQWKQVTGTLDGANGEMRLYFDGLLVAHKSTTVRPRAEIDANPPPPAGVFIGNATDGGLPFIGLVDEVLLYSRALSAAEVQGLVTQGAPFIISQSTHQTVAVGDSALFRVSVSGEQPLTYQWSLGGSNHFKPYRHQCATISGGQLFRSADKLSRRHKQRACLAHGQYATALLCGPATRPGRLVAWRGQWHRQQRQWP